MNWLDLIISMVSRTLIFGTPILWAALGEITAERSGIINLGVEGMMLMGAISGFGMTLISGNPIAGLFMAGLVGGFFALIHAFISITLKANQYVSGLAITLLGQGLSGLIGRNWEGISLSNPLSDITVPVLNSIPIFGSMFFKDQNIITYLGFVIAILLWALFYRTRWGIVIRSVGESPGAADTQGINIFAVRYLSVIFGGVCAGIAGGFLSVAYRPAWTAEMTSGLGWVALALTILAMWNPLRAIGGAFLFGSLYTLAYMLQSWILPELLMVLPYLATIIVLAIYGALRAQDQAQVAPGSLGQPYERGE